jgi:hypothetical protein
MARLKDKNEKEGDKDKKIKGGKPSSSSGYGATESLDEDDNVY